MSQSSDDRGRTPIADGMKQQITAAFQAVPAGKRGALLVIADEHGARAHLAAKIGDSWKVAGGAGVAWRAPQSAAYYVAVEGSW